MEFIFQVGIFAIKTLILVLGVGSVILLIAFLAAKAQMKPELKIEDLGEKLEHTKDILSLFVLNKEELKKLKKAEKEKAKKKDEEKKPTLFVLNFNGDVQAEATDQLRQEITAITTVAQPGDEVCLKVESPGGVVHGYGLAAAQVMRLRDRNIPITVCVDKVAASGGYLMSVPAHKIIAAPFAIIGSIGVVAQVPNIHRLLKKFDVDYKEYTAGEYKRTVSVLGEVTEKGEEKFVEQLEETHVLFKSFVHQFRPQLDLPQVTTGEYWYGEQALKLGLIDSIKTSDDYVLEKGQTHRVLSITIEKKKSINEKLSRFLGQLVTDLSEKVFQKLESKKII